MKMVISRCADYRAICEIGRLSTRYLIKMVLSKMDNCRPGGDCSNAVVGCTHFVVATVVSNHRLNFAADVRAVTGGSIFGGQHMDACAHDIVPTSFTQH
jgi:hypothetical protein